MTVLTRWVGMGAFFAGVSVWGCAGVQLTPAERSRLADEVADRVVARLGRGDASGSAAGLPADPHGATRVKVKTDGAPVRGAVAPLVTVVVFSDFECPFCRRAAPTMDRLLRAYPDQVALVFRQNPLPFHAHARGAATATLEAFAQGGNEKFWALHDRLFATEAPLTEEALLDHGRAVGLDPVALARALREGRHEDAIDRDQGYALSLEATGTPSFFLNGRKIAGARPYADFDRMVQEEITYAEALLAAGVPRAALYDRLMAAARQGPPPMPEREATVRRVRRGADDAEPAGVELPIPEDAPTLGPADATVTMQIFSDFECPFCSRVLPTLDRIRQDFPNIRFVYRHYPLPFHRHAALAHEAAQEVFSQAGAEAFWAYHDLLFDNQQNLEEGDLVRYGSRLRGVSARRLRSALQSRRHQSRIEADIDAIQSAGVRIGTPSFFINGRLLQGAQPYPRFRALIEAAQNETEGSAEPAAD